MDPVPAGPTLLGFDVIWIATILSAVATFAVLLAIYAATTVKDPMARRVKALNERREQLKAGIVASTNKRRKLTNRTDATDRVRSILTSFKMVQDDQLKKTQQKLMQAGIRTKDLAFFIIAARFIMPLGPNGHAPYIVREAPSDIPRTNGFRSGPPPPIEQMCSTPPPKLHGFPSAHCSSAKS